MRNQKSLKQNISASGQLRTQIKKSAARRVTKVGKRQKPKNPLNIPLYNLKGEEEKKLELPKEIFSIEAHPKLIAQYVRVYLANQRQGTASTKTRGEVAGSTRKIYRQKGTGRARHGDKKAPIFVGGGVVGGPKPRNYHLSLTKKQRKKALFAALTFQFKANNILALSADALKTPPKTKNIIKFLETVKISSQKIIFIFPKLEKNNFILAASNIPKVSFADVTTINPYQILNQEKIVFLEEALPVLQSHFLKDET